MSTYSASLRLTLIGNGEQPGLWGLTTNTNLGTLLEGAIAGTTTVSVTSANQALTALNGAVDQSRMASVSLTTTTVANFAVYIPPTPKLMVVRNTTAYVATVYNSTVRGNTTAAGVGVAVPAEATVSVWSDGTNVRAQNTVVAAATTAGSVTNGVYTTGDQTIGGVKTFSSSPLVPTATTGGAAVNKDQLEAALPAPEQFHLVTTSTLTLTAGMVPATVYVNPPGGTSGGVVLPAPSAVDEGTRVRVILHSAGVGCSLVCTTVPIAYNEGSDTFIDIRPGDVVDVVSSGTEWILASGANDISYETGRSLAKYIPAGFGQTYGQFIASRSLGSSYDNTDLAPRVVYATLSGSSGSVQIVIGGVAVGVCDVTTSRAIVTFTVQPGESYSITIATGSPLVTSWVESSPRPLF